VSVRIDRRLVTRGRRPLRDVGAPFMTRSGDGDIPISQESQTSNTAQIEEDGAK